MLMVDKDTGNLVVNVSQKLFSGGCDDPMVGITGCGSADPNNTPRVLEVTLEGIEHYECAGFNLQNLDGIWLLAHTCANPFVTEWLTGYDFGTCEHGEVMREIKFTLFIGHTTLNEFKVQIRDNAINNDGHGVFWDGTPVDKIQCTTTKDILNWFQNREVCGGNYASDGGYAKVEGRCFHVESDYR